MLEERDRRNRFRPSLRATGEGADFLLPKASLVPEGFVGVCRSLTSSSTTPLSSDLGFLLVIPTGGEYVVESAADLASQAEEFVKALAVLPIDEEDDELVDRVVSRHLSEVKTRPLLRRS